MHTIRIVFPIRVCVTFVLPSLRYMVVICRLVWNSLCLEDWVGRFIRAVIIVCSRLSTDFKPRYLLFSFSLLSRIALSLEWEIPLLATVGLRRRVTRPSSSWRERIRKAGARGIRQLYSGTNSDDLRTYVLK